jgi:hypothetical protein
MKKVIYIPNQTKDGWFNNGTPDFEQRKKERKQSEELRKRNKN